MAKAVSMSMSIEVSFLWVVVCLVFEGVVFVVALCSVVLHVGPLYLRLPGVCVVLSKFGRCGSWGSAS